MEIVLNSMDASLEWKIVVGRRRFTRVHRTVRGNEKDRTERRTS